jgi:hypothetical protein
MITMPKFFGHHPCALFMGLCIFVLFLAGAAAGATVVGWVGLGFVAGLLLLVVTEGVKRDGR